MTAAPPDYWAQFETTFAREFRNVAAMPPSACMKREIPADRSDETKEAESTGV